MEDSPNCHRKCGIAVIAVVSVFLRHRSGLGGFAIGAGWGPLPANHLQMGNAIGFGREQPVNLYDIYGPTSLWHNYKGSQCHVKNNLLPQNRTSRNLFDFCMARYIR